MSSYRLLRELGSRAQHSYAALRGGDLVVVQRFVKAIGKGSSGITTSAARTTSLDAESMALLLRDARSLAKSSHPNIAGVKHVDLAGGELTIATEMIEGATLQDLTAAAATGGEPGETTLPIPVGLRIVADVLTGLHALHSLKDGLSAPLDAIHGELCPANVVVGRDGIARIVNVLRTRPVRISAGSEAIGYAAPEALETGGTDDPRADVYSAGVLLWEALTGRRLWNEKSAARALARQREENPPAVALDRESPFSPRLVDVALRALAFEPSDRYGSIAEMMAEVRRIAGTRLASSAAVAVLLSDLVGESIRARRTELDPQQSGARQRAAVTSGIVMRAAERSAEHAAAHEPAIPPLAVPSVPALSPLSPLSPISPILPVLLTPAQPIITQVSIPTPARSIAPIAPAPIAPSAIDTFVIEREAPPKHRVLFAAALGIAVAIALAATIFVVRGVRAGSLARDARAPAAPPTPVPMPTVARPEGEPTSAPTANAMEAVTPPTGTTASPPPVHTRAPPPSSAAKKKSVYEP